MFMFSCLFITMFIGIMCISNDIVVPCKKKDWDCMTQTAKEALPKIAVGIPSLGIESSDPLHLSLVEGDLSGLKYKFVDCVMRGFKNCDINNVRLDVDELYMRLNLSCHDITNKGKYTLNGRLLLLPVQGDGDFDLHIKRYDIGFETELKKIAGSDGKMILAIKKYKYNAEVKDGVTYNFTNLFNGENILTDTVLQFANTNWKEVADYVQGPALEAVAKKLGTILNTFLKTMPVDEIVV